jgi:hypothetical protein
MSCCLVPLIIKMPFMRIHCNILWHNCKTKFPLALSIHWFHTRFKEIGPIFHFSNLYWCLFQETPTSQHFLRGSSSDGALTTAPIAANVSDPYIQEIASSALLEIDWRSNDSYRQTVIRIVEARKQVCLLLICIVAVVYCIFYCSKIPLIHYSWYLAL